MTIKNTIVAHYVCILANSSYCSQGHVNIEKVPKITMPLICFREGSPPLPDVNTSLTDSGHQGTYLCLSALAHVFYAVILQFSSTCI